MEDFDAKSHWEGVLSEEPGLAGVGYRGLGEPFNRWMYRIRRRVVLRTLRPLIGSMPSRTVLDIGSGTGFYVERWQELGIESITGLDITDTVVARLRNRFPQHRFERADIGGERAELPSATFGAVSAFDVLFHIVDDERYRRAFSSVFELLAPGGLFIFSENFINAKGAVRVTDQTSRPRSEITAILADAGFEIVLRRPMFFLMNEPVDSASARHRRFWWRIAGHLGHHGDARSWAVGAALYPIELAILALVREEGPSTELMVCRKQS